MSNYVKKDSPNGVLYFLFMVYYRLNNEEVWKDFFRNSNPDSYKLFIHSSLPHKFIPPDSFPFVLVPTVRSEYFHLIEPMNQLLRHALNVSYHNFDRFIFLSENTIPIKPFHVLVHHFVTAASESDFCITPTDQWLLLNRTEYSIKHHQWITLNRHNATSIVAATASTKLPFADVLGKIIPSPLGHAEEEFWHHLFLYSRFDATKQSSYFKLLSFPYNLEQGSCITYVHWPDYDPMSVFRKEVSVAKSIEVDGQHIIRAPLSLLSHLKNSSSFFFVRKFVDNGTDTYLPPRMRKRIFQGFHDASYRGLLSLRDAATFLKIFE